MERLRSTWGCALGLWMASAALAQGGALKEEESAARPVMLPSGIEARLQEVLREEEAGRVRARYVAEGFRKDAPLEQITADLDHLCAAHVLPYVMVAEGMQVIVSLAGAPTEFGVANPDIAQVFEAFTIKNDRCIWEAF